MIGTRIIKTSREGCAIVDEGDVRKGRKKGLYLKGIELRKKERIVY